MNHVITYGIVGLILLGIIGIGTLRKGGVGNDARAMAHEIVAEADCYEANKEYMDWLVDNAHDEVFDKSWKREYKSRRRSSSYLDGDVYVEKLFEHMIATAKIGNAKQVVASLERLRDGEPDPKAAKKDAAPKPVKQLGEK